jgi:hypothetical protein
MAMQDLKERCLVFLMDIGRMCIFLHVDVCVWCWSGEKRRREMRHDAPTLPLNLVMQQVVVMPSWPPS